MLVVLTTQSAGAALPTLVSATPDSGTSVNQTFSFTASDTDGWLNLSRLDIIFNRYYDAENACYFTYHRTTNIIYLVKDNGNAGDPLAMPLGGGVPQVENSQCIVFNSGTVATGSGNQLTLKARVTFKQLKPPSGPHFYGHHVIWVSAMDASGNSTGLRPLGVHRVTHPGSAPAPIPQVLSLEPGYGGGAALTTQTIRVDYHSPHTAGISSAQVLINTVLDGHYACYITWSRANNSLYLFNDAATAYSPIPLGGTASHANSQCTVYASGSSAVDYGEYLALTIRVSATSTFANSPFRAIYVGAQLSTQLGGANTGWHPAAGWNIRTAPDVTAPILTKPVVSVTSTGARFEWQSNELADSQVLVTGGPSSPLDPTKRISQKAEILFGLAPATTYSFTVYSRDSAGNTGTATGQFRTADAVPIVSSSNLVGCEANPPALCRPLPGLRWEATGAAGTDAVGNQLWAHGWWDEDTKRSYISMWNVTQFTGQNQLPPKAPEGETQIVLADLNIAWDLKNHRWLYVGLTGDEIWFGASTDASGNMWKGPWKIIGLGTTAGVNQWDYPSVAVADNGDVLLGAVGVNSATEKGVGYAVKKVSEGDLNLLMNGMTPEGFDLSPSSFLSVATVGLPPGSSFGTGGRIIVSNQQYHVFAPELNASNLPVNIVHRTSTNATSWSPGGLGTYLLPFSPPKNETDTTDLGERTFFSPSQLAAAGDPRVDGRWIVGFQFANGVYNNVAVCSEDRGCGYINTGGADQFLPGVGLSPGGMNPAYWVSYHTILGSASVPGYTIDLHGWALPHLQQPVGKVLETKIYPVGFTTRPNRCEFAPCRAPGDFMTMAAQLVPAANSASVPYIHPRWQQAATGSDCSGPEPGCIVNGNNLEQKFLRLQLGGVSSPDRLDGEWVFVPPGTPLPAGAPHLQRAPLPGLRSKWVKDLEDARSRR
ncbi:MAG: hypothetical protein R2729_18375 [Bryobacteraceae bacterium]